MTELTPANVHSVLGRYVLADGMPLVLDLEKSHGSYLHDAKTGTEYLDFFGFFASRPLAYNHPKLKDIDFQKRLLQAALIKPSNCDVYTECYAEFVGKFASVALQEEFRHVFFVEGGSVAVENALKAAFDWKHRKNLAAGRPAQGSQVIHFKQAFHGRTGYALSITDSHDVRKSQYFPKFSWPRITNPKMRFPLDEQALAEVQALEATALAEIDAAFSQGGHDIAAIIIEPIQGEGGDNYFRPEFLNTLRELCDQREVLLIFDEIQTGFAATGKWWDYQNLNVKPDLLVFGKKTQVCGFAATERIDEVEGVFRVPSRISSTFSGGLVDMVRCSRTIDVIVEDDLLGNAAVMGEYLHKVLRDLGSSFDTISNVRGRGLWAAFDLPSQTARDSLVDACYRQELLLLPCGESSIRLRPALDITADAVGRAGAQLEAALKELRG